MFGFDLIPIIKSLGYIGIFSAIILENSIPILFFVPGDTLLLTAGFLASQSYLNIEFLMVGGFVTAVFGYMLGYWFGHHTNSKFLANGKSRFIKPEHIEKTREFYNKYGNISVFLARFLPLRACVCFLAGVTNMNYKTFMFYNVTSAFLWGVILPLLGYFLGSIIPIHDLKKLTLIPIGGIAFMVILVPILLHFYRQYKKS